VIRLLRHWLAIFGVSTLVLGGERCGMIYVDWELVLALASGIATIGVLFLEHRRANRFEELAVEHAERLATLEANAERLDGLDLVDKIARLEATSTDALTVETRIAQLEARSERDEHLESRLAELGERVKAIETTAELGERITRLEAAAEIESE
jgi:hypothetical protein